MRLISSLTAAAAALADHAADRLDTWVEHTTAGADAPRETPLGFTVPTVPAPKGVDAMGLTGEQRAQWLAEVEARLDASTGGPWCTEERDRPTGRITSPYGVIATGVTREADRDLIEDARADLYGLLALAKHDDEVIEQWSKATADYAARAGNAERELEGMKARERAVDGVLDALVDGRLKLAEYVDPETPAGRVRDLVDTLLKQVREAEARADTLERKLDAHHRHDAELTTADDVRARAAERILAYAAEEKPKVNDTYGQVYLSGLETAAALIVDGEDDGARADIDTDSPFLPAAQARAETHLIKVALNHINDGHDPRGVLHFNDRPLAARVVETIMRAHEDGAAAAERIRAAAKACEEETRSMFTEHEVDAEGYLAGLRDAARIAADETTEADPNVAHIDAVNGRAPEYTPGPVAEAILNTGGTIVVDDNGDPHVTDVPLANIGPGTLITSDGKRHRFTASTATPLDDTEDDTDA